MPDVYFKELQADLLRAGIAPRHVRRTVTELEEHFDDLLAEHVGSGTDPIAAHEQALADLGSPDLIVEAMHARPELHSWAYRFPRIALLVYPLTYVVLLPVMPVFAGVAHAPQIARWGLCMMLGGLVTASMFLLLQLSILLA